ncbi:hypothetical protein HMPREF3213_01830 [Heyndrickxia coagulans]|jgi:hypothetical protein|uniref:Uncharacterized protein n=1 Tax=Heyndrickxia coagulans TaxID=1398 RepID=A0A133KQL9_HEYCO|nr:hypothetical protein HMPREF3213_01830 [Heyndrickxia coagulans]
MIGGLDHFSQGVVWQDRMNKAIKGETFIDLCTFYGFLFF